MPKEQLPTAKLSQGESDIADCSSSFSDAVSSLAIGLKDELPRKAHPRTYDGV